MSRAGAVVFLEFSFTLPIFALLFLSMTAFHLYYKHTRAAWAEARLAISVECDRRFSGLEPAKIRGIRERRSVDGLAADAPGEITHLNVHYYEGVSARRTGAPGFLGNGEAVGYAYQGRDCWSYFEIEEQVLRDPVDSVGQNLNQYKVESMPWIFYRPAFGAPLQQAGLRL